MNNFKRHILFSTTHKSQKNMKDNINFLTTKQKFSNDHIKRNLSVYLLNGKGSRSRN